MKITFETVWEFVKKNDAVTIIDTQGNTRVLKSGERDSFDLVEKADRFQFQGKWHTRSEFEGVLDGASR